MQINAKGTIGAMRSLITAESQGLLFRLFYPILQSNPGTLGTSCSGLNTGVASFQEFWLERVYYIYNIFLAITLNFCAEIIWYRVKFIIDHILFCVPLVIQILRLSRPQN